VANLRRLREALGCEHGSGQVAAAHALFAIDLDNFKSVNDRYDHSMGDRVLCAVADALTRTVESGDLVVRRGGDEFAILVDTARERDLDALATRVAAAIEVARASACPGIVPSASVGYIRVSSGESISAMMERADEHLHHAKVASRARRAREASAETARTAPGVAGAASLRSATAVPPDRGRRRGFSLGSPWVAAAALMTVIATSLLAVSALGLVPALGAAATTVLVGALLLGAVAMVFPRSRQRPPWALHVAWTATLALTGLAIALAGPAGAALLDLVALVVLYGFLLFVPRSATAYLVAGLALYGALAIGGGFSDAIARVIATTVAALFMAGVIAKLRSVTIRFARETRDLSELDALTGVANIRAARSRLEDMLARAASRELHPAVLAIDLDDFKPVNDRHSHSMGDRVLVAAARAIATTVRVDDLVARRGGDEFLVIFDDFPPCSVEDLEHRVAGAIARARSRVCPDLASGASVAGTRWQPGEDVDTLLARADQHLHVKKLEAHARTRLRATA
jgi:diguanylate cyclase (GGDEF)-like protein